MPLIQRIYNLQISEDARVKIRVGADVYQELPLIAYYPYGLSDPTERWKCRDCVVVLPGNYELNHGDYPAKDFPGAIAIRAFSVHEEDLKELRETCFQVWHTRSGWFILTRNGPQFQ